MKCHANFKEKDRSFFESKAKQLRNAQFRKSGTASQLIQACVEASFEVAYRVAKNAKNHTVAENLIMPCAKLMVEKVCGEEQAKKLAAISVSIDDLAEDFLAQVVDEVKASSHKFAVQFDESTVLGCTLEGQPVRAIALLSTSCSVQLSIANYKWGFYTSRASIQGPTEYETNALPTEPLRLVFTNHL